MMQLTDLKLIDLCPSSLKNNPDIIAICQALQPEFDEVDSEIDNVLFIPNLENQPDDVLEVTYAPAAVAAGSKAQIG